MKTQTLTTIRAFGPTGPVSEETLNTIAQAFTDYRCGSVFIEGQTVEVLAGLKDTREGLRTRDVIGHFDALCVLTNKLSRNNIFLQAVLRLGETYGYSSESELIDGGIDALNSFGFFVPMEVARAIPATFTYFTQYPFLEVLLQQSLPFVEECSENGTVQFRKEVFDQYCLIEDLLHETTYMRHLYLNSLDRLTHPVFSLLCTATWRNNIHRFPSLTSHLTKNSDLKSMSTDFDWTSQASSYIHGYDNLN